MVKTKQAKLLYLISLLMFIIVIALLISTQLGKQEIVQQPDQQSKASFSPMSIQAINYFPGEHTWERMRQNFDEENIKKDFDIMKDLNINTVRIFLYSNPLATDFENTHKIKVDKILQFAEERNMKVIFGLEFNDQGAFPCEDISSGSQAFLEKMVSTYKDNSTVYMWELTNEPHCGNYGNLPGDAKERLKIGLQKIKSIAQNHLVSVALFQDNVDNAPELLEVSDMLNFHLYDVSDPSGFFDRAKSFAGSKPIFVGEFGCVGAPYHPDWGIGEARYCPMPDPVGAQGDHIENFYNKAKERGFVGIAPWILSEFAHPEPGTGAQNTPTEGDKHFGLVSVDNNYKKAATKLKSLYLPSTTVIPSTSPIDDSSEVCSLNKLGPSNCENLTLNADLNESCCIGIEDFMSFTTCYGKPVGSDNKADYTKDGQIDIGDFPKFKNSYIEELNYYRCE